jgi:hypothetical protein
MQDYVVWYSDDLTIMDDVDTFHVKRITLNNL